MLNLHDPKIFRRLHKPMGAQTRARAQLFKQKYRESSSGLGMVMQQNGSEEPVPAFHYGTHYSSAAVIFYYLLRIQPYTSMAVSFQSGRFDQPDRLFQSFKLSWSVFPSCLVV